MRFPAEIFFNGFLTLFCPVLLVVQILASARPDLLESAIVLKFRSPSRPPQPISWSELQADPEKMQEHLGTRDGSFAWLIFTLQRFGSLSLNVQYAAICIQLGAHGSDWGDCSICSSDE